MFLSHDCTSPKNYKKCQCQGPNLEVLFDSSCRRKWDFLKLPGGSKAVGGIEWYRPSKASAGRDRVKLCRNTRAVRLGEEEEGGLAGSCSMHRVNRALGRATEHSRRPVGKLQWSQDSWLWSVELTLFSGLGMNTWGSETSPGALGSLVKAHQQTI